MYTFLISAEVHIYDGFKGDEMMLEQMDIVNNIVELSGDHLGNDVLDDLKDRRLDNSIHIVTIGVNLKEEVIHMLNYS